MPISVSTSEQQIAATVTGDNSVTATVQAGFGATGPSGVVTVSAPITNSGTSTSANIGLSVGTGLSAGSGSIAVTYGTSATSACVGNDARLSDSREWSAETVSQAEAEAGTATTRRAWTAQRIFQAIAAWWSTVTVGTSKIQDGAVTAAKIASGQTISAAGLSVTAGGVLSLGPSVTIRSISDVSFGGIFGSPTFVIGVNGHVTTGEWRGTAVAVAYGGTGATTASAARANLGLGSLATKSAADIADVTGLQTALDGKQPVGTYATLVGGTVPSAQLPSYVDDVVEVANYAALPGSGETGKIYVTLADNKVYRWSGSAYIEIVASPGSTDAVPEGTANLYFTEQRALDALPAGTEGYVLKYVDDEWVAAETVDAANVTGLALVATSGYWNDLVAGMAWSLPYSNGSTVVTELPFGASGTVLTSGGESAAPTFSALPTATNSVLGMVRIGSGVTITDGVISVSTSYAAASHTHGNITNAGAIGTTSGLIVTTGASGALGTLAQGTAGQVLKVNGTATGVEWGSGAEEVVEYATTASFPVSGNTSILYVATDDSRVFRWTGSEYVEVGTTAHPGVSVGATASDVLSAANGVISAGDPGADRLVFWDDSASKLTHLQVGSGLAISGTTLAAAQSVATPSQITSNQNDYSGATADINRISSDATRDITGIAAGVDGQAILLVNIGSHTITLKHQSASSTAANRIIVPWASDYLLDPSYAALIVYDNTTGRWRVV